MRLKQNSSTAIVVRKSWANLAGIQAFLHGPAHGLTAGANAVAHASAYASAGSRANRTSALRAGSGNGHPTAASSGSPDQSATQPADDSHTIFARVLDDTDERGLWIELNTEEHERNAAVELQALMIPWRMVLAVVVGNEFGAARAADEAEELELSLTAR